MRSVYTRISEVPTRARPPAGFGHQFWAGAYSTWPCREHGERIASACASRRARRGHEGRVKNVLRATSFLFTRFARTSLAYKTSHRDWANGRGWVRTSDLSRVKRALSH